MSKDKGASSLRADRTVAATTPSAEALIRSAIKRALEPLNNANLGWPEYYRRLQAVPEAALSAIYETGVLFRLPEQADWPLLIEAFEPRPYTLTIRTQMTIGGQTFGFDQQQDDRMLWSTSRPVDRDLAIYMAKRAIRATLEAVAEPFYERAATQFAQAIEARRGQSDAPDPVIPSQLPEG